MTKPIAAASSASVIVPSHDDAPAAPPPPAPKAPAREANQLDAWSSPAADAATENIESAYGWGINPDMEAVNADLSKLDGFALLKTLNRLDADGKLESILNDMTPDDRQRLVNQAIKGNLLQRKTPDSKLEAKFEMPASFQKMVDDLNVLQGRQKPTEPLAYNWSSYREDFHDVAKRKFIDEIGTLQPGDSLALDLKGGVAVAGLTAGGEAKVDVKRDANGEFTIGAKLASDAGAHIDLGAVKTDPVLGAGSRVEYRFKTAAEAKAAAELFATSPAEALAKYGRPAAVELEGTAAFEAASSLGIGGAKLAALKGKEEAKLTCRVELGEKPTLTVTAEVEGTLKAGAKLGTKALNASPRGVDAHGSVNLSMEVTCPLKDPDAFLKAPVDYLQRNATQLLANADAKVKMKAEKEALHHGSEQTLEVTTSPKDLQRVALQVAASPDWERVVAGLGEGVSVKLEEKHYELKHVGVDLKAELKGVEVGIGAGYERKTLENKRVLYQGSATRFAAGQPG